MEPMPDLPALSDDQLKQTIEDLKGAEREISYQAGARAATVG
jgi:hypothetical protein